MRNRTRRSIFWGATMLLGLAACGGGGGGTPTSPTTGGSSGSTTNATPPALTAAFVPADSAVAFYVFGATLPSGVRNPTWEIETADQTAPVFAAMTGRVMAITTTSQGDQAVTLQTADNSIFVLVHDHVTNVLVSVGQTVPAGTRIGTVGRLNNGRGRTELQLNRREPAPEVAVCLRSYYAAAVNDAFQAASQRLNGSTNTCLVDTVVP